MLYCTDYCDDTNDISSICTSVRPQTSADALCRLFTEKELACDRSSHSESEGKGKGAGKKSRITETLDFKRAYNRHFNDFFSRCLLCSTLIARDSSKGPISVPIPITVSLSVEEMEGQKEGEEKENENVLDVLESLLSSLCCVTDYATSHIDGETEMEAKGGRQPSLTHTMLAIYCSQRHDRLSYDCQM